MLPNAGGKTGRGRDGGHGHAGSAENGWIDDDDVSHRQKRGQTGEQLRTNRGAVIVETKEAIEHCCPLFL